MVPHTPEATQSPPPVSTTAGNSGWGTTTTWFESQDINSSPDGEQIWDINLDHKSDSCHHPHMQTCCWERFLSHGTPCSNLFFSCCRPNNWESSCLGHDLSSTIYYNNYLWQPNASFFLFSLSSFSLICFIKTMSMNSTFRCTQCYSMILWAHS